MESRGIYIVIHHQNSFYCLEALRVGPVFEAVPVKESNSIPFWNMEVIDEECYIFLVNVTSYCRLFQGRNCKLLLVFSFLPTSSCVTFKLFFMPLAQRKFPMLFLSFGSFNYLLFSLPYHPFISWKNFIFPFFLLVSEFIVKIDKKGRGQMSTCVYFIWSLGERVMRRNLEVTA